MKIEEIEKGIKCCNEFLCGECPYKKYDDKSKIYTIRCMHKLMKDINTLYFNNSQGDDDLPKFKEEYNSTNGLYSDYNKKCIVLEIENKTDFESKMNKYLSKGYKVEASSCNSKYYKAILILEGENI